MVSAPFPNESKESCTFGRLREALGAGLGGHSSLRVLWLHANRIGDSGLQALGGGKGLESAGPEDILDIRLRDGKFQGRRFTSARAQAIAEGLAGHKDLRNLSLSNNGFGDAGTQAWS